MTASTSEIGSLGTAIPQTKTLTDEMGGQGLLMAGGEREKIGTPDVHVAPSARMNKTAGLDAMVNLTGGKTETILGMPILGEDHETEMGSLSFGEMASLADPDTKEAGSAMRMLMMVLMATKRNRRSGIVTGVATGTRQTVNGPGALNSNKNLNGWIPMTKTSRDERIPRKILSDGRSG